MSALFVWYELTASPAAADRARDFYAKLFDRPIAVVVALPVPFPTAE